MAIKHDEIDNEKSYFICHQQSTTGPNWIAVGDNHGLFENGMRVEIIIEGFDPQFVLNNSLQIDSPNNVYIIYGEITSEGNFYGKTYPVVTSNGYDIIYPIERGSSLRFFAPSKYLTFLDYNWSTFLNR